MRSLLSPSCVAFVAAAGLLLLPLVGFARQSAAPTTVPGTPDFSPEQLEQIVAPVALYPDSLLSQIFMAATYPLEVVQADRWMKDHPNLKDDALTAELEKQTWDPSVKSLVNFPQVLDMMNDKLDWTVQLGDAFIGDEKAVMDAVQKLRAKAQAEGNLQTNEQQNVVVQPAPAGSTSTTIIEIEPADPQVIYVPTYNPTVVYGAWPYPAYPPYYYRPPGYVATAAISFGVGFACGAAWGYAWGGCDWHHGDVDIDIDRNTNFNRNIDRSKYKAEFNRRDTNVRGDRSTWQHDPSHRGGVAYRDRATQQRYGGTSAAQADRARDAYRGRAETGRQDLSRGGASQYRGTGTPSRTGAANRTGSSWQNLGTPQNRAGTAQNRAASPTRTSGTRSSAFDGADRGGRTTQAYSNRGQSSRQSYQRSSGGGGSRSAAGGSRGGGARGGGRR